MDDTMQAIGDGIILALTWLANGGLVTFFWLLDHVLIVATLPALYQITVSARLEQRTFALVSGGLSLLAAIVVPAPIPVIVLTMAWAGVAGVALDKFNPDSLRWRVIGGLALYAVAAIAWTGYSAYVANLSPEQWAAMFAADEAASTIAQGRSFLSTISVWGLWIIIPLGYFSLLLGVWIASGPKRTLGSRLDAKADLLMAILQSGNASDGREGTA